MIITNKMNEAIYNYKAGNINAFSDIYTESCKYIYVCINNIISGNDNKEDMIQDIMQDTYVEIYKHLDKLQNVDKFYSWAGTIATRKCYETLKKSGKYQLLNEDESFDNISDSDNIIPEEIMQNKEKQHLIKDIINTKLTYMQKICIINFYYNEMKQTEIAKELNIPKNSVKSNILRAKTKIKEAVIELEKTEGTKLYSLAPFMAILFADEIEACIIPTSLSSSILENIHYNVFDNTFDNNLATNTLENTVVNQTVTDTMVKTGSKLVMSGIKKKIIIGLSALIIGTTSVVGVAHILGKEKNKTSSSNSNIQETTKEVILETSSEPETTTVKKQPEQVNINESDFENYEKALEWLFFSARGTEYIEESASNFLTDSLISKEIEYRKNNNIEDVYNTKIFSKYVEAEYTTETPITKVYVPYHITETEPELVTFEEMENTLIKDGTVRYAFSQRNIFYGESHSWYTDSMSIDEILLNEKENAGFHNISILSVDNRNRTLEIYDNTYSCRYTCTFNDLGLINKITVTKKDKERYRAFYEFLSDSDNYFDYDDYDVSISENDTISVSIRDFDGDGIEEMLTSYCSTKHRGHILTTYNYENGEVILSSQNCFEYTDIYEITKNGFISAQGGTLSRYLVEDISFHTINKDGFSYLGGTSIEVDFDDEYIYYSSKGDTLETFTEAKKELYDTNRNFNSIKARSTSLVNDEFLTEYSKTHGFYDDIKKETLEKNKDWFTSYKNFLLEGDFSELLDGYVAEPMVVPTEKGTVKGFFLYDLTQDGQPELMIQKRYEQFLGTICYTYDSEKKCMKRFGYIGSLGSGMYIPDEQREAYLKNNGNGLLLYNHFPVLGYRTDNGNIISFDWNGGSQSSGIKIIENNAYLNPIKSYGENFYLGEIFNPEFCPLEQDDKSIYDDIITAYRPFKFVDITMENIDKYIVEDYKTSGLYDYTLDECDSYYSDNFS